MVKESDQQLLQLYLRKDSEKAFQTLVDRHLPLVHSVARRVTANAEAASDIAQKIFLKLVQRTAPLPLNLPLTAWLHRETHSASVDYVRSEVRRQNREYAAAEMTTINTEREHWNEISPVIDQAVDSLTKDDRAVVLLRFYENKSYAEISRVLGVSGDAARMRANRALDKLRDILGKHHITTSSALLTIALPSHAITTPPASLASTITSAAAAAAKISTPLFASLTIMNKSYFVALAAALVTVPIIGFQQYRVSTLKSENETLRNSNALTRPVPAEQTKKLSRTSKRQAKERSASSSNDMDIASSLEQVWSLVDGGLSSRHPDIISLVDKILERFSGEEVFAFCDEMEQSARRTLLVDSAMRFHGAHMPEECFEFASNEPVSNQPALARAVLFSWFKISPDHAVDWFLENELKETPLLGGSVARDSLSGDLARSLVKNENYDEALSFVQKLTGSKRQGIAINKVLSRVPTEGLVKFGNSLLEHAESASIHSVGIEKIASKLAANNVESGKEWALALSTDDPAVAHAAIEGVASLWMKTDSSAAATWWVQNGSPKKIGETYSSIVAVWAESTPVQCAEWLEKQTQSSNLDGARAAFSRAIAERDLESAKAWAQEISNENLRAVVEQELGVE